MLDVKVFLSGLLYNSLLLFLLLSLCSDIQPVIYSLLKMYNVSEN